ncbi:hypothetical protein BaRGS_00027858 [Batillaria attramentaria]|uniref:Uncharacterized protein n=1 Tax=Batillaria attramentaria TaxID=370345 RepID=A0ABD0K1W6_9CAEN
MGANGRMDTRQRWADKIMVASRQLLLKCFPKQHAFYDTGTLEAKLDKSDDMNSLLPTMTAQLSSAFTAAVSAPKTQPHSTATFTIIIIIADDYHQPNVNCIKRWQLD